MKKQLLLLGLLGCVALMTQFVAYSDAGEVKNAKPVPSFTPRSFGNGEAKLTFLVMGDWGIGDENQKLIAKRMNEKAAKDGASLVLVTGDNFYPRGVSSVTDAQWKTKWRDVYTGPALQIPFFVSLGNHDYLDNPQAEVDYTQHDPRWHMPARTYSFTQRISDKVHADFFALDTDPLVRNVDGAVEEQTKWLEEKLKSSTATWKIAFGHHPVYSNGKHGNTSAMIKHIKPLLEKYNVDVYLCGHDHDIQILQPVNGVHYIVSGGGAGWRDVNWGENTIYAQTNLGFVWCAVTDTLLHVQCLDRGGRVSFAYDIKK